MNPPIKTVLAQLAEQWSFPASIASLKRVCKQAGLVWKRVRKSSKSKRDRLVRPIPATVGALAEQAKQEQIDLVYFKENNPPTGVETGIK